MLVGRSGGVPLVQTVLRGIFPGNRTRPRMRYGDRINKWTDGTVLESFGDCWRVFERHRWAWLVEDGRIRWNCRWNHLSFVSNMKTQEYAENVCKQIAMFLEFIYAVAIFLLQDVDKFCSSVVELYSNVSKVSEI